ncbi:hypothetical protein [Thiomicrorhabdus sp. Milos-T2]|uniref:hypothetical protein n=1 Tax=Thiomicrorhabdus sp. Milos-T2 TaxID=90814 RepID=UPI000493C404|nr:hypothetical protein [Thiomicrorhabdus sp. Milos-T2]
MAVIVEPYFMNELPFSLREVTAEVYLREGLEHLVEMRFKEIDNHYKSKYSFNTKQWQVVLNTSILTQLSAFTLGKHLSAEDFKQLRYLVQVTLEKEDAKPDEVLAYLEEHAHVLASWYSKLIKLSRKV